MAKQTVKNIDDRSRNIALLLYPDNDIHNALILRLMSHDSSLFDASTEWEIIGIKHNSLGEGVFQTKEHFHIYLIFPNPMYVKSICYRFGFFNDDGSPDDQFVRAIKGRKGLENSILYLTHMNKPEKEQYSASDLFGSSRLRAFYDRAALNYLTKNTDKRDIFSEVRLWLSQQSGVVTAFQMVDYLISHCAFSIRNESWLREMWREHNTRLITSYNKQIQDAICQSAEGWANILGQDLEEIAPDQYASILNFCKD